MLLSQIEIQICTLDPTTQYWYDMTPEERADLEEQKRRGEIYHFVRFRISGGFGADLSTSYKSSVGMPEVVDAEVKNVIVNKVQEILAFTPEHLAKMRAEGAEAHLSCPT